MARAVRRAARPTADRDGAAPSSLARTCPAADRAARRWWRSRPHLRPFRSARAARGAGRRSLDGRGRHHTIPHCLEPLGAEHRARGVRRTWLATSPLKVRQVFLLPFAAPATLVVAEDLRDVREPRIGPVPQMLSRNDVDGEPVPVPALEIGRRSEEHTSELQSRGHLVCRLLLEKKNKPTAPPPTHRSAPLRIRSV